MTLRTKKVCLYSLLIVVLCGLLGYWFIAQHPKSATIEQGKEDQFSGGTSWETYTNEKYGFRMAYPSGSRIQRGFSTQDLVEAGLPKEDGVFQLWLPKQVKLEKQYSRGMIPPFLGVSAHMLSGETVEQWIRDRFDIDRSLPLEDLPKYHGSFSEAPQYFTLPSGLPVVHLHELGLVDGAHHYFIDLGDSGLDVGMPDISQDAQAKYILNSFAPVPKNSSSETRTPIGWKRYHDERYGFSLLYPDNFSFCANDYCGDVLISSVHEKRTDTVVSIDDYEPKIKRNEAVWEDYIPRELELEINKNLLGQSVIEFAKENREANWRQGNHVPTLDEEITFLQLPAYQFDVQEGWGEGGYIRTADGMISSGVGATDPNFFGRGKLLRGDIYHVLYFEKGGNVYRALYPKHPVYEKIMKSFRFDGE